MTPSPRRSRRRFCATSIAPACAPTCGANLNEGPAAARRRPPDSRWAALAELAERLSPERARDGPSGADSGRDAGIAPRDRTRRGCGAGPVGRYPSAVYDRPAVRLAVGGTPVGATWLFRSARPPVSVATRVGRPTPSRRIASGAARIAARPTRPHRVCGVCGQYRGRQVVESPRLAPRRRPPRFEGVPAMSRET